MRCYTLAVAGVMSGALALAGCKVGPNYKVPAMPAPPAAYSEEGRNGDWTHRDVVDLDGRCIE